MARPLPAAPPSGDPPRAASGPIAIPIVGDTQPQETAAHRPPVEPRTPDKPSVQVKPPAQVKIEPVLRSKIQPPPLRTSTLSRQRLIDRLASATRNRLTLVIADAGYGKTTLLADFSRRFDGACLWYSLESSDADWSTILHHLVAAARQARPEFGRQTSALLRTEPGINAPKGASINSFLNELEEFGGGRVVLVFDDVHAIGDSRDAAELLLRVVRDAPRNFSFVLASRHRPSFALARWGGMGELVELTTDDLRFSAEETARLFADGYGQPLDLDVLHQLDDKTRGWVACLQLFSTLISNLPSNAVRSAAHSLSGASRPLYDYLAQEVVAHLPEDLQSFLTRASLLQVITPEYLAAMFSDEHAEVVVRWLGEADSLGLLNRNSQSDATRQFHPLLRDILVNEAKRRIGEALLTSYHLAVARAAEGDPLVACHHYIEAGDHAEAMRCLGSSSLHAMGSGRWGTAAQLAARMAGRPNNGGVAAIQARRLMEDGNLVAASTILQGIGIEDEDATVRAVVRQTRLTLGWRAADGAALTTTVAEILADPATPPLLRDIAQVHDESISSASNARPLIHVVRRLRQMAESQRAAGYGYYAAVSLHNAAFAAYQTGRLAEALRLGQEAIEQFVSTGSRDYHSTHAVLTTTFLELGQEARAEEQVRLAMASGGSTADVPAVIAFALAMIGERDRAKRLLTIADDLDIEGHTDVAGKATLAVARAILALPEDPDEALYHLDTLPAGLPLELGIEDRGAVLRSLAHLLAERREEAAATARAGLTRARRRGTRLSVVRLEILRCLTTENAVALRPSIGDAAQLSALALAELADAIGRHLHLLTPAPEELTASVAQWPLRWLPVLRKQLEAGDVPRAHAAATLLDTHGANEDVTLLRAFDKTYRRKGWTPGLGKELARRVSPRLLIHDLGQVALSVGGRAIRLSKTRRKPAALLMYLVSRPNHQATRDQIVEDLWGDADTSGALNSLNQSLYFIRREIDPWYEDDISPEYITYQAELIALDPSLVQIDSVAFVARSRELIAQPFTAQEAIGVIASYTGPFSPEFEYEDWAMAWRAHVHGAYFDLARAAMVRLAGRGEFRAAVDIALGVLAVDPSADDVERSLIWLYWRLGARSAAEAQYNHLASQDRADGLEPTPLAELTAGEQLT